jgi:hypothetical protein
LQFLSKFIGSSEIGFVRKALIQIHEKHKVVSQRRELVHGWSRNQPSKQIVHKRGKDLVPGVSFFTKTMQTQMFLLVLRQSSPWQMRHTFQGIIDENLREHQQETKSVNSTRKR